MMAMVAMCSAKGSPGVTVAALAFTLTWARRCILAECDPAGGDIAAGYLREVPLGGRGLAQLTASLHRQRLAEDLWAQLVDLYPGKDTAMSRLVLPGLSQPAQAAGSAIAWPQLAALFRSLETNTTRYDVIADCGRLTTPHRPSPILAAADAVLLVLRPILHSIQACASALDALRHDGIDPVALLTVGDGAYSPKEIALELRTPVVAALPNDPATAAVLSTGGELLRGRLLRAAAKAEPAIWQLVAAAHSGPGGTPLPAQAQEVRSVH